MSCIGRSFPRIEMQHQLNDENITRFEGYSPEEKLEGYLREQLRPAVCVSTNTCLY